MNSDSDGLRDCYEDSGRVVIADIGGSAGNVPSANATIRSRLRTYYDSAGTEDAMGARQSTPITMLKR